MKRKFNWRQLDLFDSLIDNTEKSNLSPGGFRPEAEGYENSDWRSETPSVPCTEPASRRSPGTEKQNKGSIGLSGGYEPKFKRFPFGH